MPLPHMPWRTGAARARCGSAALVGQSIERSWLAHITYVVTDEGPDICWRYWRCSRCTSSGRGWARAGSCLVLTALQITYAQCCSGDVIYQSNHDGNYTVVGFSDRCTEPETNRSMRCVGDFVGNALLESFLPASEVLRGPGTAPSAFARAFPAVKPQGKKRPRTS